MNHTDDYLSKMLPGFEKQPNIEPLETPVEIEEHDLAPQPVAPSAKEEQAPKRPEILNEIVSFLRRYLICDDHQLTLLTSKSFGAKKVVIGGP
jgi:hypothetical protein